MGKEKWNNACMKALFITPSGHESDLIVSAWNSWNEPAMHRTFDVHGESDGESLLQIARDTTPDVIFYVGGNIGSGLPSHETFQALRTIAPSVHLCWDATDVPWHDTLRAYKKDECFNLQVAMDGGKNSPVDMATLTPVDPRPYKRNCIRTIRCAFAGQNVTPILDLVSTDVTLALTEKKLTVVAPYQHPRWYILTPLVEMGLVEYRKRRDGLYNDYADYIKGCQILLNISHTGTGKTHHVKLRIVEAGFAGCGLLEMRQAPTCNWVPEELLFLYTDIEEAAEIIKSAKITEKAAAYSAYIRENYSPQKIYETILARL